MAEDVVLDELTELLTDDYYELSTKGDKIEAEKSSGFFETVAVIEGDDRRWVRTNTVITLLPDGRYVSWTYDHGLTESQDNTGPAEYGKPEYTFVTPREVVVTTTVWDEVS